MAVRPPSRLPPGLRFDRFALSPALEVHLCRAPAAGHRVGAMTNEFEVLLQLDGEAQVQTVRGAQRVEGPRVAVLNPGDCYDLAYQSGLTAWFVFRPEAVLGRAEGESDLRLQLTSAAQARLCELTGQLVDERSRSAELNPTLADELCRLLRPHVAPGPRDPLALARHHLVQHFDSDLYLAHLAEVAHLHPTVFLRRFKARYGETPVQYRIKSRLNEAARLGWRQPQRALGDIARSCGFSSVSYFHRAFRRYLGATPERHRTA